MNDTLEALQKLKQRIVKLFPEGDAEGQSWFFPPGEKIGVTGVEGYEGIGPVMIVGPRPSFGGGNSPGALERFYQVLAADERLRRAHLTDIVKERGTGNPTKDELERNWRFFVEELKIIQPTVVLALGDWVFLTLGRKLDRLVPLLLVTHYAYRFNARPSFKKDMERVLKAMERRRD